MRGAFQVAKFFNIPVRIHWTFFLLILWIGYAVQQNEGTFNWLSILVQTGFVLILFICVILHEFGHALMARKYGVSTLDIIISPIGGVARLNRMPEKPIQEFWVAIAGPLVNFAIIVLLGIFIWVFREVGIEDFRLFLQLYIDPYSNVFPTSDPIDQTFFYLILINLVLAVFNLLPAFPLDGGRIFRALLSIKLGRLKATRVAAYIGQFFALLLIVYGLWQNQYITAFIGFFVFSTASGEYRSVRWEHGLDHYLVKQIMDQEFLKLLVETSIEDALQTLVEKTKEVAFVIDPLEEYRVVGIIVKKQIEKSVKSKSSIIHLRDILNPLRAIIHPEETLRVAFQKMDQTNFPYLPVIDSEGQLVGGISYQEIENFISTIKG